VWLPLTNQGKWVECYPNVGNNCWSSSIVIHKGCYVKRIRNQLLNSRRISIIMNNNNYFGHRPQELEKVLGFSSGFMGCLPYHLCLQNPGPSSLNSNWINPGLAETWKSIYLKIQEDFSKIFVLGLSTRQLFLRKFILHGWVLD